MFASAWRGREGSGRFAWRATQHFVCAVLEQLEAVTGNTGTNGMQGVNA